MTQSLWVSSEFSDTLSIFVASISNYLTCIETDPSFCNGGSKDDSIPLYAGYKNHSCNLLSLFINWKTVEHPAWLSVKNVKSANMRDDFK